MPMTDLEFEYIPLIERKANGKRSYFVDAIQDGGKAGTRVPSPPSDAWRASAAQWWPSVISSEVRPT